MGRPLGVFEVQLVVSDLERATAFYEEELGLEISLRDPNRGRTHFRLAAGQLILALAGGEVDGASGWPGLPPPLLVSSDARGAAPVAHGAVHFALQVASGEVVPAGERLRAAGHDVRGPFRWPRGELSIYLRDPDGNVVELISEPGRGEGPG